MTLLRESPDLTSRAEYRDSPTRITPDDPPFRPFLALELALGYFP
jgi:hypothetical protein